LQQSLVEQGKKKLTAENAKNAEGKQRDSPQRALRTQRIQKNFTAEIAKNAEGKQRGI